MPPWTLTLSLQERSTLRLLEPPVTLEQPAAASAALAGVAAGIAPKVVVWGDLVHLATPLDDLYSHKLQIEVRERAASVEGSAAGGLGKLLYSLEIDVHPQHVAAAGGLCSAALSGTSAGATLAYSLMLHRRAL